MGKIQFRESEGRASARAGSHAYTRRFSHGVTLPNRRHFIDNDTMPTNRCVTALYIVVDGDLVIDTPRVYLYTYTLFCIYIRDTRENKLFFFRFCRHVF